MENNSIGNNTQPPEGDRGLPEVNRGRGHGKGFMYLFVVAAVIAGASVWGFMRARSATHEALQPSQRTQQQQQANNSAQGGRVFDVPVPAPVAASAPEGASAPVGLVPPLMPQQQADGMRGGQISPREAGYNSSLIAGEGSFGQDGGDGLGGAPGGAAQGATPATTGPLASALSATRTATSQASVLAHRQFLVPKGTQISCDLKTALNSDVPGMTSCVLTTNVYSDDGTTLLLERGSEATGEYRSDVRQGQKRLFVLWDRIRTPAGVVVNLDSPGTDALGRSGLTGYVDNHWVERLGAAFLLSIIQDAIGYETAKAQRGAQGTVYFQNTASTGDQMGSKILDNTINIPPTISKNQGERINIFVARDLDFSQIYDIVPKS